MLPRTELGNLRLRVAMAEELAEEGRWADGYDCLLAGLRHATRAVMKGKPWAPELFVRFLAARDAYVDRHGVPVEPADPPSP
jgi:hypothetical protein